MSQNIEEKLEKIVSNRNIYRTGRVTKINSFVVETSGLDDVFYFEKVYIGSEKNIGYVDKIEANKVYISIVQEKEPIRIGDNVLSTKEPLMSYFSEECMGMIVDMFGSDKLTGKPFNNSRKIKIETPKIGIMDRTAVNRPLETGIAAIDMLYPIGRGQRQLIIGDKKIGKTQIALDTIVNQKDKDMICIYIAIGKTKKEIKSVYTKLIERGANAYTIIVSAFNDDPVPVLKLTPYVGMSMAEEYLKEGKDVLVIIDDLKKHADACREISLIANKNTGRDAYPADIFYTHSRLLEKGCQHKNGGSITVLPIIETKGNDITDYISTNVISITDGQIVLSPKLFEKGQKPAIDYGLSVSRLGSAVQREEIIEIGSTIRKTLLSYLETAEVYELVNEETMTLELKHQLKVGKKILQMLKQPKYTPLSASDLASRFQFIYTENTDVEEIKNEKPITAEDMEEIIPMPEGLNESLNNGQSITFEELPNIKDGSNNNWVSPSDTIVTDTFEEIIPDEIISSPVVEEIPVKEVVFKERHEIELPVNEEMRIQLPNLEEEFTVPRKKAPKEAVIEEVVTPPIVEAPVVEAPIVETPIVDTPIVETPVVEAPIVLDAPIVDAPIVEAPVVVDAPVVDTPISEDIPTMEEFVPEQTEEISSDIINDMPVLIETEDDSIIDLPKISEPVIEVENSDEIELSKEVPIIDVDEDDIELPMLSNKSE